MKKSKNYPPWLSNLLWVAVIALTAYFTGQFASLLLQSRLVVPRTIILAKQKQEIREAEKPLGFYQSQILPALGEEKKTSGPGNTPTPGGPGKTPGSGDGPSAINWDQILADEEPAVALNGTIIGSDAAIAFFNVNGKDVSLAIGETAGAYKVSAIDKNTVTFTRGSQTKVVSMTLGEAKKTFPVANMSATARPVITPANDEADLKDMISFQGNTRVIDRRKFNALLKPPSRLANELKFIPNSKEDKPYGIKISYLKPGSFFSQIGMRSGDILIKTNQKELQSVEDSFYAYQAFRNEDHLTMEVDRDGTIIQIPMEFR